MNVKRSLSSILLFLFLSLFLLELSAFAVNNHHQSIPANHMSTSTTFEKKTMLLKHPGTCSGMFWRGDPSTKAAPPSNDNWPRNGALLEGTGPHVVDGEAYFKVTAFQQAGKTGFLPVPEGTYMLYNQGGSAVSAPESNNDDFYFGKYCKHVPRILRRQLIAKLVDQYMGLYATITGDEGSISAMEGHGNASIVRFHCALLFVDISGFTVLSQKLKVDDLKNQINAYFQKIVDIINKYDGEIIKFAGDALFIIWQTKVNDTGEEEFESAAREAAESAVNCGIEINLECGNYPITLQAKRKVRRSRHGEIKLKKNEVIYSSTGNDALAQGIMDLSATSDDQHSPVPASAVPTTAGSGAATSSLTVQITTAQLPRATDTSADASAELVTPKSLYIAGSPRPVSQTTPQATPKSNQSTGRNNNILPAQKAKPLRKRKEPTVTYLNVHAGVSMGVMAGLDVGANDRFEYLLLGRPMNEVAIAEGDAGTGEIVISPAVHDLLHNAPTFSKKTFTRRKPTSSDGDGDDAPESSPRPLSCGCTRTGSGFFKIRSNLEDMMCAVQFGGLSPGKSSRKAAMYVAPTDGVQEGASDLQYEFETYAQVIEELMAGYKAINPAMHAKFKQVVQAAVEPTRRVSAAAIEYTEKEVMMEHFFGWAQHCLLDDIARHVHEVVRKGFSFYQESRAAPFEAFINSPAAVEQFRAQLILSQGGGGGGGDSAQEADHARRSSESTAYFAQTAITPLLLPAGAEEERPGDSEVSRRSTHNSHNSHRNQRGSQGQGGRSNGGSGGSFVSKMRQLAGLTTMKEKKQSKHQQVLERDGALVSELRNVIVLFISVKVANAAVAMDSKRNESADASSKPVEMIQTCKVDSFHFLKRTIHEVEVDKKLINQFQSCMEVMTDVFHAKGGQMRQFIVDDKGTVCIGTFGLRGSVNYDNAAAAVDAADLIIARLQDLGFEASVGVTSGAAYCGLVGSDTRHEYAVMGPSTNLSARLMGRAQEGEIICDSAIRQRDRAHSYASLGAVKAKGYTNLVPIFKPQFDTDEAGNSLQFRSPSRQLSSHSGDGAPGGMSKQVSRLVVRDVLDAIPRVFGRLPESQSIFRFFLADAIAGGAEQLWGACWKPRWIEAASQVENYLIPIAPMATTTAAAAAASERRCRFDTSKSSKLAVIVSPNGMGKSTLIDLLHLKMCRLIVKNKSVYNIAVFRHQTGYINITSVLSAWHCLIRQTLLSIAETMAVESGDQQTAQCLEAANDDNFAPVVELMSEFLPAELRPFTPLLSLAGVKMHHQAVRAQSESPAFATPGGPTEVVGSDPQTTQEQPLHPDTGIQSTVADVEEPEHVGNVSPVATDLLGGAAINTESHKGDPLEAMEPAEKLQRCGELIVAIVQLHVKITRKMTFFLMDDVQQHDPASQELSRQIVAATTGICILCTYRSSRTAAATEGIQSRLMSPESSIRVPDYAAAGQPLPPFQAAMQALAGSDTYLLVNLPPLTLAASKRLFAHIFAQSGIQQVDDAAYAKLHTLSGGSPLYASELAKGICDRYIHREVCELPVAGNAVVHSSDIADADLSAIIDDFRADRIEEIVHFRFDKLTEQCQLVLKIAAVAAFNGSFFTLTMMTWILDSTQPVAMDDGTGSVESGFDAMIYKAVSQISGGSGGDSDNDEFGFEQRGMMQSGKTRLSSSIDLVSILNELLESDEFIEAREAPADEEAWNNQNKEEQDVEERRDDGNGEGGLNWLGSSSSNKTNTSTKISAILATEGRASFTATPKHLDPIKEASSAAASARTAELSFLSTKSGKDRGAMQQLRFHWKVDMELRAIYDLMLDEQKESLHDRVASYLAETMQMKDTRLITATDYFQLGVHWERATNWSSAMTCYYQSGMLLRDQGDMLGCKAHFTEAFRMLDKMKSEAGIKRPSAASSAATSAAISTSATARASTADLAATAAADAAAASTAATTAAATAAALANPEMQLHIALGGRQSGLTAQDLYKLFEGDADLLYTGFSLIVRVAQGLIGFGTGALSLQLYEEAIEIMRVLASCAAQPLTATDGLPFQLRNKDVCFIVLSGMFMLLLSGQAPDDAQHNRIQATVALSVQIARSKHEYVSHLVMALSSKLKMLDLFQAANPAISPGIIFTADELMSLYKPELHSQELVYYYSSDRAGNALGVVMKLLCLKGHFAQNLKYLDHAKKIAAEMNHFYSLSIGILVLFPMLLMYHSDSQAQVLYEKYLKTERKQRKNDFRDGAAIWMEWISQTHKFEAQKATPPGATVDMTLFATDSATVEYMLQVKVFVQAQESQFFLNLIRLHCIGVEFALANICFLKAQRYELFAHHCGDPSLHRDKIKAYLELGLLHLTFSPQQAATNQMFLFSNLHEKLLRAQLLMKLIEYTGDGQDSSSCNSGGGGGDGAGVSSSGTQPAGGLEKRGQLWQQALENLQYCAAVGKRGEYHTILLLAGRHLQTLSDLRVMKVPSPSAVPAAFTTTAGGVLNPDLKGAGNSDLASAVTAEHGDTVGASAGSSEGDGASAAATHMAQAVQADQQLRAGLRAQGVALQEQALQYLRQVNGDEIYSELIHKKLKL